MGTVQNSQPPKVFISYSWTTPEHEAWVHELAQRLRTSDGVDVKLDKWDLKEGNDKYAFMENMVMSPEIDKVLIVCDKGYQEKANENRGGVGTEKLLITPEVFESVEQTKFIPIVAERDETGKEYLPNFIKSRIYIDLSQEGSFEDNYEKLVRNIYNAPLYRKPSIGNRPAFLDEEQMNTFKTTNIVRQVTNAIESNPRRLKGLLRSFSDSLLEELEQLKLESDDIKGKELDEVVMGKIIETLPIRDNFINIIKILSENQSFDSDWFIDLFERMQVFTYYTQSGSFYEQQFDQYKFLIHEMFIYTVGLLLKNEEFLYLSYILSPQYIFPTRHHEEREGSYLRFRYHLSSFEIRNNRLGTRKFSLHAQTLIERINNKIITKQEFIESDMILHYFSNLIYSDEYSWFPITYIYRDREDTSFKFFIRLKSKRRAEKVITLFNVANIEELKSLFAKYDEQGRYGYSGATVSVPRLQNIIITEEIGSKP